MINDAYNSPLIAALSGLSNANSIRKNRKGNAGTGGGLGMMPPGSMMPQASLGMGGFGQNHPQGAPGQMGPNLLGGPANWGGFERAPRGPSLGMMEGSPLLQTLMQLLQMQGQGPGSQTTRSLR